MPLYPNNFHDFFWEGNDLVNLVATKISFGGSWWLSSKESACIAGDIENTGSIPGLGRSPGAGYPLHYSCMENSRDRGAWRATAHGVTKSPTRLRAFHFLSRPLLTALETQGKVISVRFFPEVSFPASLCQFSCSFTFS